MVASHIGYSQNPVIRRTKFHRYPTARVSTGKNDLSPHMTSLPGKVSREKTGSACRLPCLLLIKPLLTGTGHGVIVSQDKVDWVNPHIVQHVGA